MGNNICESCKSTNIRSRTNHSHGKNSKSTTTWMCKECGSTNIKAITQNKKFKRR